MHTFERADQDHTQLIISFNLYLVVYYTATAYKQRYIPLFSHSWGNVVCKIKGKTTAIMQ